MEDIIQSDLLCMQMNYHFFHHAIQNLLTTNVMIERRRLWQTCQAEEVCVFRYRL